MSAVSPGAAAVVAAKLGLTTNLVQPRSTATVVAAVAVAVERSSAPPFLPDFVFFQFLLLTTRSLLLLLLLALLLLLLLLLFPFPGLFHTKCPSSLANFIRRCPPIGGIFPLFLVLLLLLILLLLLLLILPLLLHSTRYRSRHTSLHWVLSGRVIAAPRVLLLGLRPSSFCLLSCTCCVCVVLDLMVGCLLLVCSASPRKVFAVFLFGFQ